MTLRLAAQNSPDLVELARLERQAFAAKLRLTRAVLGWSQSEMAFRVGLTQRAIHKIEQGETEPRRTTVFAIVAIWREAGLEFEDHGDGGFRVSVSRAALEPGSRRGRRRRIARRHLGVTMLAPASRA